MGGPDNDTVLSLEEKAKTSRKYQNQMASCSLTVPASSITSRRRSTSLSFFRCSISNPIISSKLNGCSLPVKSARRRKSSLAAAFEGTTTVPSDCEGEKLSFSDSSEPSAI
ncbi:hypothetical protein OIU84_005734 [Salix udensis]|uniref:Uncharacterized protein n=1 Tax=Salix udensis TaxID=889485 RepID=A0AAD6JWS3_9ROSI|nr:hypothetical protein OIU84_005734 [Salix udensis]